MRIGCPIRTIVLALAVGFFVPITGTTQPDDLERLKAEKEALQRELAKAKEARRRSVEERRRISAELVRGAEVLKKMQRDYIRLSKSLEEIEAKYVDLARTFGQSGPVIVKRETLDAKQRRDLARFERGVHLALTLMRNLLSQPSLDDSARIEILRTAARMRSTAAPLRAAIQALPSSQNSKLEAARKKALERIGLKVEPRPEKKPGRL